MKAMWSGLLAAATLWVSACGVGPVSGARPAPPPAAGKGPAPVAAQPAPGPAAAAPTTLDTETYRLASGDMVRIDVLDEPDLSLQTLIDPVGNINYPFLGRIQASGMTTRQLEQRIYGGLRSGYLKNPDVRVSIAQYRPVYVNGQVRQAGAYPYTNGLTVEKVLTLAGGLTQFGSTRRIQIQRADAGADQKEPAELGSPVFPGDTVIVQERLF